MKYADVLDFIQGLSDDKLKEFMNVVIDEKKLRDELKAKRALRTLNVGDQVRFTGSDRGLYNRKGKVVKINRTRVVVHFDGYNEWERYSVPGNLLEPV